MHLPSGPYPTTTSARCSRPSLGGFFLQRAAVELHRGDQGEPRRVRATTLLPRRGKSALGQGRPVLAIGCTSLNFTRNGKPNAAATHDLGLASATLTLEATARGMSVHQMIGILPERVRELYRIPEGVQPLTGLAIGYVADPNILPDVYRQRDLAPRAGRSWPSSFSAASGARRPGRRSWLSDVAAPVYHSQARQET